MSPRAWKNAMAVTILLAAVGSVLWLLAIIWGKVID